MECELGNAVPVVAIARHIHPVATTGGPARALASPLHTPGSVGGVYVWRDPYGVPLLHDDKRREKIEAAWYITAWLNGSCGNLNYMRRRDEPESEDYRCCAEYRL
jgi:hypothetical protein